MRILQYTLGLPPYRRGGLPTYSTELSEELAKTNEVVVVYPGRMKLFSSSRIKFKKEKSNKYTFDIYEMINPLPVSLGLGIDKASDYYQSRNKFDIERFINKINPDVIHIHTLMGLPIEFLKVAKDKKIRIVYTTHDYYGLCPKFLIENPINELKSTECSYDCMLCKHGPSLLKIELMQSAVYRILKNSKLVKIIRKKQKNQILDSASMILDSNEAENRYKLLKYYKRMFELIDYYHFNSTVARDYFLKFIPDLKGKVINITRKNLYGSNKHGPCWTI